MGHPRISIEPLVSHHDRKTFCCGVEALDRYLKEQVGQDIRKDVTTAFVLVEEGNPKVLGYYTLAATSVLLADLPESIAKKLPRYPMAPAILLGRLAVDQSCHGRGHGETLIVDAMKRCLMTEGIGWTAIVVDAKDDSARRFYERFGFMRLPEDPWRLMLPRKSIAEIAFQE